jgi:hypothetical protein
LLRDVPVLAENATQIAVSEEDGARTVPPPETILLAEMRKRARYHREASRVAEQLLVLETIDVTVPGTRAAVLEFGERRLDAGLQGAFTV